MKSRADLNFEEQRLKKLQSYFVVETEQEAMFDNISSIAATICNTPYSLINFIGEDQHSYKSKFGITEKDLPPQLSFCSLAISQNELLVVEDTLKDPRFCNEQFVTSGLKVRFYAGIPLVSPDGFNIGTLCVLDTKPNILNESQASALKGLAHNVINLLELRKTKLEKQSQQLRMEELESMTISGSWELDLLTGKTFWSSGVYEIYGISKDTDTNLIQGLENYNTDDRQKLTSYIEQAAKNGISFDDTFQFHSQDKKQKWVRSIGQPIVSADGSVRKIVGTFQDVSNYVKTTNSLIENNQILEVEHKILKLSGENLDLEIKLKACLKYLSEIDGLKELTQAVIIVAAQEELNFNTSYRVHLNEEIKEHFEIDGEETLKLFTPEFKTISTISDGSTRYYLPVIQSKNLLGALVFAFQSERVYSPEESIRFERLSSIIGLLINSHLNFELLKNTKELYSLALEGASLGIWSWNLKDDSVWFDHRWASMLGIDYTTIEMNLSTWSTRVHPDDLESCYADIRNYLDGKTASYENVHRVRHEEGHWVYILDKGKISQRNSKGEPVVFTGTHLDITAMVRSKEKLNLFFDRSPFGFVFCDMQGDFIDINKGITEITGYELEELKKLSYWDLTPNSYFEMEEQQLKQLREKSSYGPYRKEYIRKDGTRIPVELHGFIVDDYDGQKGIWSIIQDVSEKSMLEDEKERLLARTLDLNEKLEAVFSFSPVVVYECEINSNWSMNFINAKIFNISGYTASDLVHDKTISFSTLIHPDDQDYVSESVMTAIKNDTNFEIKYRIIHRSGELRWVADKGSKHPEKDVLIGVLIDITNQRKDEEINDLNNEIRARYMDLTIDHRSFSDYLLSEVLRITSSGYGFVGEIVEDSDGPYLKSHAITDISWNEETKRFFDDSMPGGLEFRNLNTLFGEVIKTRAPLLTNSPSSHPAAGGLPPGHPPLESFLGVPLIYNDKFVAMVGIANREMGYDENLLKVLKPFFELCAELFYYYKLNTALEEQKIISQHNAKLASLGELAAGVGHEINNPLAILRGQFDLLKDHLQTKEIVDPIVLSKFDKIENSVVRIANIVKGIGSLSRVDTNDFSVFNFSEMALETCELLIEMLKTEGIELKVDIETDLFVHGLRGRLQQVIVNLINNAKDALKDSSKKIISFIAKKESNFVQIDFFDSGPGIPKAYRDKIFEPFFTTKEVNKGTGIGLSIVNTIIREHSGTIHLQPDSDVGAFYKISLPLSEPLLVTPSAQEVPVLKLDRKRVLIVDDESGIRELLSDVLEAAGMSTLSFPDAISALEHLKSDTEFSVIISDIKMPKMSGIDLVKKLRHELHFKGSILLITGGSQLSVEGDMEEIDGFIAKPFSNNDFLEIVNILLLKSQ